jgi:hypothetical protein
VFIDSQIAGVSTGHIQQSSCEQSNVGITSWTTIASIPIVGYDNAMVTLNGKAYVMGGYKNPADVRMWDDVSAWIPKATMSPGRQKHCAVVLDNDRALVCGGEAQPGGETDTCVIYTASTDLWSAVSSMAQTRINFNLVMSESLLN